MRDVATFYAERDLRTRAYVGGLPRGPQPLEIRWGELAANTRVGQTILLAIVNQLARFCRRAGLAGPDAPLLVPSAFGGSSLVDALLSTCEQIDPVGEWHAGHCEGACYRVGVGGDVLGVDVWVWSKDWIATLTADRGHLGIDDSSVLLGAGMAACLATSNAFKASWGLENKLFSGSLSVHNFGRDNKASQGPAAIPDIDLGRILMVGAGAVASALAFWLPVVPICGRWDIVDRDTVKLHNTNRGLLYTARDAGWPNGTEAFKAEVLARFVARSQAHCIWYDELSTDGMRWDIVLPLANERGVRPLIQATYPPLMIHATTSVNWQTQLHRHRPGLDMCINCRLPDRAVPTPACAQAPLDFGKGDGTGRSDAALPFLSAAAGLLLATDLARVALGDYDMLEGNLLTLDWYADLGRPTLRHEQCRSGCCAWGDPQVRKVLNSKTRWFSLDSKANQA